jgi:NAD(P)-dependent dehydrogenase (short-subunit alcohol dehydrogenase family)
LSRRATTSPLLVSREGRRRKEPWIERDDVTNAILYVESDAGRFVTGTTISVDLGLRAK